ncbi:ATP-binding cassette domain-containing protein [Prosthecomicrobium hirschii]|nr:ATP-binding cassette domain-containing protein [Prosthecomicrobium hirschii]
MTPILNMPILDMPILCMNGITVSVGGRNLIEDVSLACMAGTLTGIVGPNGAGKSTLMAVAAGTLKPRRGSVAVDGRPLGQWRLAALADKRAVLIQSDALAFPFAVHEVVQLGMDGRGRGLTERRRLAILERALGLADAIHLAARLYPTLSGGERQRVRLARILAQLEAGRTVHDRQLLILDEPLAGLDLKHQVAAMAAARAFADEGHAVLAVVHDLWAAAHYSDCVLALQNGRAAEFGPPETVLAPERVRALFDLPPGTAVEAYLTAARDAVGRRPSRAAQQGNAAD